MVPSFSFSGPHFERRRAEIDPPGTYFEGKTKIISYEVDVVVEFEFMPFDKIFQIFHRYSVKM
jgi:hypothetical protein